MERLEAYDAERHVIWQLGGLVTVSDDGNTVTGFWNRGDGSLGRVPTDEQVRRLAACWNACQGITTEALEALGKPINIDELARRMDEHPTPPT